ncbi:type IV toxin-antitoxin system AbiEi family antitoxin domain-containing protein [Nocardia sp. NPDC048505]|uniref:type IV toxin-antitoxin system AbiEi family antitoxin domain-containing protein n=1 Tax=unclassified Nocardia TaxID=2637762 RepID=UPI0033D5BE63
MADELLLRKAALERGVTDYDLRRACRSGQLTRLRPGAYAQVRGPADPYARHLLTVTAAARVLGDGVVISHQSAAVLHGLPLLYPPDHQVHATVNRVNGGRLTRSLHLHSTRFDDDEITTVGGLRTTTPARTIADLARTASFCEAVVTGDAAMRKFHLGTDDLIAALHRWHRRRGLSQARQAIVFMDPRGASPGESRSRVALHFAFLPKPDLHIAIHDERGVFHSRAAFFLPEHHIVGRYDPLPHARSLTDALAQEKDREEARSRAKEHEQSIRDLGGQLIRWTDSDLDDFTAVASRWRRAIERSGTAPAPRWQIR